MIGAKALERVNSAMATVMKDTWSADLMEEAQGIYNSLEDSMFDLEETIEATWPNVTPEIQTMLCDFEVNSSFNALVAVMQDTWSADLIEEAQAAYNAMEETIQATLTNVQPTIQTIVSNFVHSSSFNSNLLPHQLVHALHQQLTNCSFLAPLVQG